LLRLCCLIIAAISRAFSANEASAADKKACSHASLNLYGYVIQPNIIWQFFYNISCAGIDLPPLFCYLAHYFNPMENNKGLAEARNLGLPICSILENITSSLETNPTLVVHAPPGAGKSTVVPLALLGQRWLGNKKIIMLEPRRLAATSIAERMSQMLGTKTGNEIGYRIRFDTKCTAATAIEVVTEGILMRMLHTDNALENVGAVIFDEFHERSIFADSALALCRDAQQLLRPDLRLVIMSATLDIARLEQLLQAPVVSSQGRQHKVEIKFAGPCDKDSAAEHAARTAAKAAAEHDGDLLIFLPGQSEISGCAQTLKRLLPDFVIHPLFGNLPYPKQRAAILPDSKGRRKAVVATSIAETSLTIEGITIVIDSGLGRRSVFDPNSGLSRLETVQISKDMAQQRAGRAGRLSDGVCYRLWTAATDERLQPHRIPEIEEADLAPLALDMAAWGVKDPKQLAWLTPPPAGNLAQAQEVLNSIGAISEDKMTKHGKEIAAMPCHPRLAHMMLMAKENKMEGLAADIAAVLEERDPLSQSGAGIDLNLRIEALRKFRNRGSSDKAWMRIDKVAGTYRKMIGADDNKASFDYTDAGLLVSFAYPERIACARPGNNAQFQLANGRYASFSHRDDLSAQAWLAVAHLDARDGAGRIFMAAPLDPTDLAPSVKTREVVEWDYKTDSLKTAKETRIGNIILKSEPLHNPDPLLKTEAICKAIAKDGHRLLNWDDNAEQWLCRITCLKIWNKKQWPEQCKNKLMAECREWIAPYLNNVKRIDDLKKIDLAQVLQYNIDPETRNELEKLAPQYIKVPSGSLIKLCYNADGRAPELSVRLQEMFGLAQTPTVNAGKQPVLLKLLSPGYKMVQLTMDLPSFWNNAYFEVKKELKQRYPKHVWPDNPWNEAAVSGPKRKTSGT
jgi:ATP-dependent helicase HrpB